MCGCFKFMIFKFDFCGRVCFFLQLNLNVDETIWQFWSSDGGFVVATIAGT